MVKKIPNILTVLRLIMIPLFVVSFYSDYEHRKILYLYIKIFVVIMVKIHLRKRLTLLC